MSFLSILKTKIGLLLLVIILLIVVVVFTSINQTGIPGSNSIVPTASFSPQPSASTSSNQINSYFKTQIGTTTASQIKQLPNLINEQTDGNKSTFSFPAISKNRDSIIVTKDNLSAFEREVTLQPDYSTPNLKQLTSGLGQPEKIFNGSSYYGQEYVTYIYASKGLAIVANPNTDEVFEVQQFKPTTLEDYIKQWGSDLYEYPKESQDANL